MHLGHGCVLAYLVAEFARIQEFNRRKELNSGEFSYGEFFLPPTLTR